MENDWYAMRQKWDPVHYVVLFFLNVLFVLVGTMIVNVFDSHYAMMAYGITWGSVVMRYICWIKTEALLRRNRMWQYPQSLN